LEYFLPYLVLDQDLEASSFLLIRANIHPFLVQAFQTKLLDNLVVAMEPNLHMEHDGQSG